jgi:hypothetical protein
VKFAFGFVLADFALDCAMKASSQWLATTFGASTLEVLIFGALQALRLALIGVAFWAWRKSKERR